jgi:hypothetical protein
MCDALLRQNYIYPGFRNLISSYLKLKDSPSEAALPEPQARLFLFFLYFIHSAEAEGRGYIIYNIPCSYIVRMDGDGNSLFASAMSHPMSGRPQPSGPPKPPSVVSPSASASAPPRASGEGGLRTVEEGGRPGGLVRPWGERAGGRPGWAHREFSRDSAHSARSMHTYLWDLGIVD